MQRAFILKMDYKWSPDFLDSDKFVDDLCSFLRNGLFISEHIRADSCLYLFLNNLMIKIDGREFKGIGYHQFELVAFLRKVFFEGVQLILSQEKMIGRGVYISKMKEDDFWAIVLNEYECFILEKDGSNLGDVNLNIEKAGFIIGPPSGFSKSDLLKLSKLKKINVGKVMLHASQVPIIINHYIDGLP